MVELRFSATSKDPPEIQSIAKNYIDLLYSDPSSKRRILRDDRQISYLSVRYDPSSRPPPRVMFHVNRLSTFQEMARLARDLTSEVPLDRREIYDVNSCLDQLNDWRDDQAFIVKHFGRQMFVDHLQVLRSTAQMAFLENTSSVINSILLQTFHKRVSTASLEKSVEQEGLDDRILFSKGISSELGRLPRHGGSAQFAKNISCAIEQMRDRNSLLFPLMTEIALVVFYLPPRTGGSDLDNLAQRIIPVVHRNLCRPESDSSSGINLEISAADKKRRQITRFEVVKLTRTESDNDEGSVHLALCDGCMGQTFAEFVEDIIEKCLA